MKAVRFHKTGTPDVLQVDELPKPEAKAGEVLIRVEAIGVNFADTIRRRGEYYPVPTVLPCITSAEAAGTVEAVGPGVDRSLVGSRVFGFAEGAGAEFSIAPAQAVFPVPKDLDPVTGVALFVQGLTAALMLKISGPLRPGQSVFVEGAAGGVGSLAVQLARIYGAGTIIGGASTPEKRKLVLELGADHAIEYRRPGWTDKVRELTGGRGVDLALNSSGDEIFNESLDALARGGKVIVFGSASGTPPRLNVERMFVKGLSVTAFLLPPFLADRDLIVGTLEELAGYVRDGRLNVQIGGQYPLARTADAHRYMESGHSTGKLVLIP
jgi:NADPH2:quinone reductase